VDFAFLLFGAVGPLNGTLVRAQACSLLGRASKCSEG